MPEDVIKQYKIWDIATPEGFVYVKVQKSIYGLPQSDILSQQLLEQWLAKHGYTQSKYTPGFWKYAWQPISFTLAVNDFGAKYIGGEHAQHLKNVLEKYYIISKYWEGKN